MNETDASGKFFAIVTTVQPPTSCARRLADAVRRAGGQLIVAGDKKGPQSFDLPSTRFLSLQEQLEQPFSLPKLLPTGHYARKNVAYLAAIRDAAACIYETDDDNAPDETWQVRSLKTSARRVRVRGDWLNVYRLFSPKKIWPRGFPLNLVCDPRTYSLEDEGPQEELTAPVQQGLANGSPDVDAVWRLLLEEEFRFDRRPSVALPAGVWCPFNSQSTWWWPPAFPLLYLPSFCSFRMTDIWRSFIAQRCLWEFGCGVIFHPPEVVQERNVHNLMRDFKDEVPGYLGNERFAAELGRVSLEPGHGAVGENLLRCYRRLVGSGFFEPRELPLVEAWLADLPAAT